MVAQDTHLKRAISLAAVDRFTADDWIMLGLHTGTSEVITGHDRLLRSQRFGDDDYPRHVSWIIGYLLREVGAGELMRVVEELIDLPDWLLKEHPRLYQQIYGAEFDGSLIQLELDGHELGVHDITRHTTRIRLSIDADPEQAIGSAKELLETVLKTILDDCDVGYSQTDDIPKLVKHARHVLDLESGQTGTARDRVLNGLTAIANGVNELRNLHGTGHGRSRTSAPEMAYAHLVVNSSAALARFLLEIHSTRRS